MFDLPASQQDILWRHIDRITARGDAASLDAAIKAVKDTLRWLGV